MNSTMALAFDPAYLFPFHSPPQSSNSLFSLYNYTPKTICSSLFLSFHTSSAPLKRPRNSESSLDVVCYRLSSSEDEGEEEDCSFDQAVFLFNEREYYKCHDVLEALWNEVEEPTRTLIHGILQCAVGFHHLFSQNHRGAMMELGEGLCKLRKMNFQSGPFHQFEEDIAAALEFIYQTQIELAACGDDLCVTMDQSEKSYLLLGGYASGQHLYHLQSDPNQNMYIVFCSQRSYESNDLPRVKLPVLKATEEHLSPAL